MCLHVPCVLHLRKYIVHSKGGVAESWVLSCWSFWFFAFLLFWFLVFLFFGFWFCLAIAEKPSRNCQWLQSSERTIADAVVAKMRCAVSVVAECSEKPHSQGVPFCIYNPIPFSPFSPFIPIVSHVSQLGSFKRPASQLSTASFAATASKRRSSCRSCCISRRC